MGRGREEEVELKARGRGEKEETGLDQKRRGGRRRGQSPILVPSVQGEGYLSQRPRHRVLCAVAGAGSILFRSLHLHPSRSAAETQEAPEGEGGIARKITREGESHRIPLPEGWNTSPGEREGRARGKESIGSRGGGGGRPKPPPKRVTDLHREEEEGEEEEALI